MNVVCGTTNSYIEMHPLKAERAEGLQLVCCNLVGREQRRRGREQTWNQVQLVETDVWKGEAGFNRNIRCAFLQILLINIKLRLLVSLLLTPSTRGSSALHAAWKTL